MDSFSELLLRLVKAGLLMSLVMVGSCHRELREEKATATRDKESSQDKQKDKQDKDIADTEDTQESEEGEKYKSPAIFFGAFDCQYSSEVLSFVIREHFRGVGESAKAKEEYADRAITNLAEMISTAQAISFTQSEMDVWLKKYDSKLYLSLAEDASCELIDALKVDMLAVVEKKLRESRSALFASAVQQDSYLEDMRQNASVEEKLDDIRRHDLFVDRIFHNENEFYYFVTSSHVAALTGLSSLASAAYLRRWPHGTDDDVRFVGVGVGTRRSAEGYREIAFIHTNGPVGRDGRIQIGDIIEGVSNDGEKWHDLSQEIPNKYADYLSGEIGRPVYLQILRPENENSQRFQRFRVKIFRDEVFYSYGSDIQAIPRYVYTIDDPKFARPIQVGYLRFDEFTQNSEGENSTASWLEDALREVFEQEADVLMVDLRNNSGGGASTSLHVVRFFIENAVAVYAEINASLYEEDSEGKDAEDRQANRERDNTEALFSRVIIKRTPNEVLSGWRSNKPLSEDLSKARHIPLVFLVGRNSASASELTSGALKAHGRALILGERTFGKGTIQMFPNLFKPLLLSDVRHPNVKGSSLVGQLRFTIGKYYYPDGTSPNRSGVSVDVMIPSLNREVASARHQRVRPHLIPNDYPIGSIKVPSDNLLGLRFRDAKLIKKLNGIFSKRLISQEYESQNLSWLNFVSLKDTIDMSEEDWQETSEILVEQRKKARKASRKFRLLENKGDADVAKELVDTDHEIEMGLFISAYYYHLCRGEHERDSPEVDYDKTLGCSIVAEWPHKMSVRR